MITAKTKTLNLVSDSGGLIYVIPPIILNLTTNLLSLLIVFGRSDKEQTDDIQGYAGGARTAAVHIEM